jgi:hypothetical protein
MAVIKGTASDDNLTGTTGNDRFTLERHRVGRQAEHHGTLTTSDLSEGGDAAPAFPMAGARRS